MRRCPSQWKLKSRSACNTRSSEPLWRYMKSRGWEAGEIFPPVASFGSCPPAGCDPFPCYAAKLLHVLDLPLVPGHMHHLHHMSAKLILVPLSLVILVRSVNVLNSAQPLQAQGIHLFCLDSGASKQAAFLLNLGTNLFTTPHINSTLHGVTPYRVCPRP